VALAVAGALLAGDPVLVFPVKVSLAGLVLLVLAVAGAVLARWA